MPLFHWKGHYKDEDHTQKVELFIYSETVESARKLYGSNKNIPALDQIVKKDNYTIDDSEGLRILLHYKYHGHYYFYVPNITVMYLDETYKKPKTNIGALFDET